MNRNLPVPLTFTALLLSSAAAAQQARYVCGAAHSDERSLSAATRYAASAAGFDLASSPSEMTKGACSGDEPFFVSFPATDGNYRVTLVLGGPRASTTTVRAESRRLMVNALHVAAGGSASVTFNVHVRTAAIAGTETTVKLKPREIGALDWDDKLTLEFNGERPSVRSIAVERTDVPTVYLAGDSTVVDQDKEPWAAWGQMLPAFFGSGIAIANEAESGETIKSFVGERRLAKIESTWKRGDYLLVQFAHNDQKQGSGFVSIPEYTQIMERYIADARAAGVTPILVTAMNRRRFDAEGHIVASLGEYPQATRDVAAQEHLGLIDLNAMSKTLFETMGEQGTLKAFVHFPPNTFPEQPEELKDDTHFTGYGAYELACALVESIREQHLPLEPYLRQGTARFDPAHPLPFAVFHLPASPFVSTATPYGR